MNATPEFFCDCEGKMHRRDRCPNWTPREATGKKNRHTPAERVRIVEAQDGFVCRNPVCRDELPLHGSHLTRHADGEFLGYGYDLEPRTEELDPHPGSSHVGHSRQTPPRGRKAGPNGAARPRGGS